MAARRIVVATHNSGKVREIGRLLGDLDIEMLSLRDFPHVDSPDETGSTFEENALIKARHAALDTGTLAVADDSGLEVDAIGGLPGVRSARFAGDDATDEANNQRLLELLRDVPAEGRTARFRSVVAVCSTDGRLAIASGSCEGRITTEPRGSNGFGYDPLFFVPELGMTFGEAEMAVKNRLSHRGRAFEAARPLILGMLGIPAKDAGHSSGG